MPHFDPETSTTHDVVRQVIIPNSLQLRSCMNLKVIVGCHGLMYLKENSKAITCEVHAVNAQFRPKPWKGGGRLQCLEQPWERHFHLHHIYQESIHFSLKDEYDQTMCEAILDHSDFGHNGFWRRHGIGAGFHPCFHPFGGHPRAVAWGAGGAHSWSFILKWTQWSKYIWRPANMFAKTIQDMDLYWGKLHFFLMTIVMSKGSHWSSVKAFHVGPTLESKPTSHSFWPCNEKQNDSRILLGILLQNPPALVVQNLPNSRIGIEIQWKPWCISKLEAPTFAISIPSQECLTHSVYT